MVFNLFILVNTVIYFLICCCFMSEFAPLSSTLAFVRSWLFSFSLAVTPSFYFPFFPGWEMRMLPSGQPYFLDHFSQTTTFLDPRTNGPMPQGWNIKADSRGRLYFVDHIEKRSHWTGSL
jgi:hypothetical protein